MNPYGSLGKILVVAGIVLAVIGGLVWLLSKTSFWGNLPGDIRIERPGFTCLIPLASSILLSIVLSVILTLIVHLLNR